MCLQVVKLLLDRGTAVDLEGKNQVTPLHVAAHYNNEKVALLLLERGASPHAAAKNGYTPLHIAAKKNQVTASATLLKLYLNLFEDLAFVCQSSNITLVCEGLE